MVAVLVSELDSTKTDRARTPRQRPLRLDNSQVASRRDLAPPPEVTNNRCQGYAYNPREKKLQPPRKASRGTQLRQTGMWAVVIARHFASSERLIFEHAKIAKAIAVWMKIAGHLPPKHFRRRFGRSSSSPA
eukprot:scaffold118936_cov28-Tisochrysis_lutea.AAC.1